MAAASSCSWCMVWIVLLIFVVVAIAFNLLYSQRAGPSKIYHKTEFMYCAETNVEILKHAPCVCMW